MRGQVLWSQVKDDSFSCPRSRSFSLSRCPRRRRRRSDCCSWQRAGRATMSGMVWWFRWFARFQLLQLIQKRISVSQINKT